MIFVAHSQFMQVEGHVHVHVHLHGHVHLKVEGVVIS